MRYVTLTISPEGGVFHPVGAAVRRNETMERGRLHHVRLLPDGSVVGLYSGIGDPDELSRELTGHADVIEFEVFEAADEVYVYSHVAEGEPLVELLSIVEEYRLILDTPMEFTDDGVTLTAVGEPGFAQDAIEAIPDGIDVEIHRMGEYTPDSNALLASLTDRQREVLETAVDEGYYAVPREASHEDVAAAVGCAPSTASEHLRKIEARLMSALLGRS